MSDTPQHPIQWISRASGLSAHVIRIWEQRYSAVQPQRTGTNRRLYSDADLDRLKLLRAVTQGGHSIGQVAQLPTEMLRKLALSLPFAEVSGKGRDEKGDTSEKSGGRDFLKECLAAIRELDPAALNTSLRGAATELGNLGMIQRVIAPLAGSIGELWREGELTAAHEHFATATLRTTLSNAQHACGPMENAPALIVATPAGQVHEMGALIVAAVAANLGWQITYLGASLPAAEIAGAARQRSARAVALSLVYPEDDPAMETQLERLRELLPSGTALLVGGRAMPAYSRILKKLRAIPIDSLKQLGKTLDGLRAMAGEPVEQLSGKEHQD